MLLSARLESPTDCCGDILAHLADKPGDTAAGLGGPGQACYHRPQRRLGLFVMTGFPNLTVPKPSMPSLCPDRRRHGLGRRAPAAQSGAGGDLPKANRRCVLLRYGADSARVPSAD